MLYGFITTLNKLTQKIETVLQLCMYKRQCAVPAKIHTGLPQGRLLEIPRERGVLKAKILEAKYEANLEFPGGMGVKNKQPPKGGYGYFLELHNPIASYKLSSACSWITTSVYYITYTGVRISIVSSIATMCHTHRKSTTISIVTTSAIVAPQL